MKKAIWTEAVAERFGYDELIGRVVEYEEREPGDPFHLINAKAVYHNGERIAEVVTIGGPEGITPIGVHNENSDTR